MYKTQTKPPKFGSNEPVYYERNMSVSSLWNIDLNSLLDSAILNSFRLTKVAKDWPSNSCNITFSQQFNNALRKKEQCAIPFVFWLMPYTIQV